MTQMTVAEAVWAGDYWGKDGAIARARREYDAVRTYHSEEPSEALLERRLVYMNALYSALGSEYPAAKRGNLISVVRCLYLVRALQPFYESLLARGWQQYPPIDSGFTPDQEEMLAAQLAKYSTVPCFGNADHAKVARALAESAFERTAGDEHEHSHTPALAALTLARLDLSEKRSESELRAHILFAQTRAGHVEDPNQKARILRSCAELWNELDFNLKAQSLIREALEIPGIGNDVRSKLIETRRVITSS